MVTSRYPPLVGGVETHVNEVARRMAARGVDVSVLTTDLRGDLPPFEQHGNLTVQRFPAWPRRADLYVSPALLHEVARTRYDLVHVQGVNNLLPPTALASVQRAGVPTVVTFHTGGHSGRLRTAIRETQWQALRPLLRRSKGLVAVCSYEVEQFSRRLGVAPETIRLIRNGADILPIDNTVPDIAGCPLVCSVGRLERYKGHQRVIAAMPALLEMAPAAHLAVVGRGSYERQLRHLVARLNVEHAVTFTAFDSTERAGLGALVRSSDVVVLMSDYEANPVSVMEALALGRKVVVADTSGLSELASEGLATAVPANVTPRVLAQRIVAVAASPEEIDPELPTWDRCTDDLLSLYDEITSSGSRGVRPIGLDPQRHGQEIQTAGGSEVADSHVGSVPTVSVVISAYSVDRWNDLVASVESLQRQSVPPVEILVVIDDEPLLGMARNQWPPTEDSCPVRIMANDAGHGLGGARNTGVEHAVGDVVAFLDDDARADCHWVEHLSAPYVADNVIAVGGAPIAAPDVPKPKWWPMEFDWVVGCAYRGLPTSEAEMSHMIGAAMSARRKVLTELGGFHSDTLDDLDLSLRLASSFPGQKILFAPRATVEHRVPAERLTWRYFWHRCYIENRRKVAVVRQMGDAGTLQAERRQVFRVLPSAVGCALADGLRRRPYGFRRAAAILCGVAMAASGFGLGQFDWWFSGPAARAKRPPFM